MKFDKFSQTSLVGGAALALILAMGSAQAAKPGNKGGASIGISNTCALTEDAAGKPVLMVTTTVVNKSSEDATPYFANDSMIVIAEEKANRGKPKWEQVGDTVTKTASLGIIETPISLCKADGTGTNVSPDAASLNATVSIDVVNDNKAEYSNRCSDDPATDGIDEGKVLVSPEELDAICMLP